MDTGLINLSETPYSTGSMPEIFELIETLNKRLRQFHGNTLREAQLTPPQYMILSLLGEKDQRPFKELAELLSCTRATVTGIVDTMQKKGLVTRSPNPDDRRSLLVTLTEKGRRLLKDTPELQQTFASCCFDVLPSKEVEQLYGLLRKLALALPF
ncbi:MAG TPA: MarR family transcriptional regulator [Anaerolineales bacterium]|nr:MarR family transcriptional regulator [Anaerolineales bacterium]